MNRFQLTTLNGLVYLVSAVPSPAPEPVHCIDAEAFAMSFVTLDEQVEYVPPDEKSEEVQ